jgi:hypothetical protein
MSRPIVYKHSFHCVPLPCYFDTGNNMTEFMLIAQAKYDTYHSENYKQQGARAVGLVTCNLLPQKLLRLYSPYNSERAIKCVSVAKITYYFTETAEFWLHN